MIKFETVNLILKNNLQITFRHLLPEDAEEFIHFRQQIARESTNTMLYVGMPLLATEEMAKRLRFQYEDQSILNLAAFDKGKIIGYLNFRLPHPEHPWAQHIGQFGMMVLKDYWGLGIATHLLRLQELHAKKIGVNRIEAMVRVNNERGIKLYASNGYKVEGSRRQAAKIEGEYQDEYFIAKILDEPKQYWKPPTLQTERLLLRPIELEDAEAIFSYAKNPNVCKYTLWEPHQSVQDSLNYIQDYVFDYYNQGVPEPFGIALKKHPEKIIGTVGCFWTSKQSKAMELAYAIAEEFWGQGLVAEASLAVMDFCFKEFNLKRIQSRCKTENKSSARVMEKVGMTFEGTLRSAIYHRAKYWDLHYYAKVLN